MPPRFAALVAMLSLPLVVRPALAAQTPGSQPPAIVQPGAPGEPSREIAADKAADVSRLTASPADVKFMQGMIGTTPRRSRWSSC